MARVNRVAMNVSSVTGIFALIVMSFVMRSFMLVLRAVDVRLVSLWCLLIQRIAGWGLRVGMEVEMGMGMGWMSSLSRA